MCVLEWVQLGSGDFAFSSYEKGKNLCPGASAELFPPPKKQIVTGDSSLSAYGSFLFLLLQLLEQHMTYIIVM